MLDQYDLKMEELAKENDGLKAEKSRFNEHIEIKEKIIENLNAEINEMNQIKFDMEKEQSEYSEASKTESIPIETFNEQKVLGKFNFQIFYNPPISEDAFLPVRSESPKRKLGFREIFSENTKRYISQFNTEPRKRSFEKSESEKSPSIAVDLS